MKSIGLTKYLTISEFAKIANTNRKKLIYYDKINLFKPSYVASNGYRYYLHHQIETYFTINTLSKLGMPLEQIKKYLQVKSPKQALSMLTDISKIVQNEIDKLISYQNLIFMRKNNIQEAAQATFYHPFLENIKQRFIFATPEINAFTEKIPAKVFIDLWQKATKLNIAYGYSTGYIITKQDFLKHQFKQIHQVFFELNPKDKAASNAVLPAGTYLVNYGRGHYGNTSKIYQQLFQFIKKHHYQVIGNASEEYLVDEVVARDPNSFVIKVSILIKK